jgi:hypothetical protein
VAGYQGTWRRAAVNQSKTRLVPPPDPQHETPDANPNGVDWEQSVFAPMLPLEMVGDQYLVPPTMVTLVDRDVDTHDPHPCDAGEGPLDTLAAQDLRTAEADRDRGASASRLWTPVKSRDGTFTVTIIPDVPGQGDQPDAPRQRFEQGVGVAQDPYARAGRRIARWRDRWVDMHRWNVEYRPHLVKTAYPALTAPPVPGGNQYNSPAPTEAQFGAAGVGTPDQLVWPVERRAPRPWDESATTDGSELAGAGYGLTTWGL